MKKIIAAAALFAAALGLVGCSSDAEVASDNLSKAADNFEVNRRVVFFNGITDKYLLEIDGKCSIDAQDKQVQVTCKTPDGQFKKHFLGLSDNVSYIAEQIDGADVSTNRYRVVFKPEQIVPDIRAAK